MNQWNCCRTCLKTSSLNPIFDIPEKSEKYTETLLTATGLKIEINDNLSQFICTQCISLINQHMDFRSQCQITYEALNQMQNKSTFENNIFKIEQNRPDYLDDILNNSNEDICPDNGNLYSYNKEVKNEKFTEIEMSVQDVLKKRLNITINNLKSRKKVKLNYAVVENKKNAENRLTKEIEEKVTVECDICHKTFKTKGALNNHFNIHMELKVICEHCGKKFRNKRKLLMHCKSKHGYEKTDKCSYCDYRASNAELVKIHERLHTGERPYACAQCGAGFHRKSSYLQHVAIHLPDKTVQCEKCPALFKSVTLMRIHASRHKPRR